MLLEEDLIFLVLFEPIWANLPFNSPVYVTY